MAELHVSCQLLQDSNDQEWRAIDSKSYLCNSKSPDLRIYSYLSIHFLDIGTVDVTEISPLQDLDS